VQQVSLAAAARKTEIQHMVRITDPAHGALAQVAAELMTVALVQLEQRAAVLSWRLHKVSKWQLH
jgi:hypothetical protein